MMAASTYIIKRREYGNKKKTEIYVFIYPTHCCAKHCLLVSIKPNGRKSKRTSVLYSNDKTDIVAITAIGSESEFLRAWLPPRLWTGPASVFINVDTRDTLWTIHTEVSIIRPANRAPVTHTIYANMKSLKL